MSFAKVDKGSNGCLYDEVGLYLNGSYNASSFKAKLLLYVLVIVSVLCYLLFKCLASSHDDAFVEYSTIETLPRRYAVALAQMDMRTMGHNNHMGHMPPLITNLYAESPCTASRVTLFLLVMLPIIHCSLAI